MNKIIIRPGIKADVPSVLGLIRELAEYEKEPDSVEITEDQLLSDGFGSLPAYKLLVAESQQQIVGFVLILFSIFNLERKRIVLGRPNSHRIF